MQEPERNAVPPAESARTSPRGVLVGRVLFECYRSNSAWAPIYYGIAIDDRANIWFYDRKGKGWSSKPVDAARKWFDGRELHEKFSKAAHAGSLPREQLDAKALLIPAAQSGDLTRRAAAADGGVEACIGYIWDQPRQLYQTVELRRTGNVVVENDAPSARELATWLEGLFADVLTRRRQD